MDESILRTVKKNLSAKFYATNDVWLRDCVEYYLSEHNNPSDSEVLEFVISQWQLSDLREISNEKPCLPKNLAQEKCTTLRGHFILQMEKVYDIAESKYKQLEKIRNVATENIRATEVEATQAWEPKKKRMLQFHLTDGAQDVTAIEYKPIRFLSEKLLPGYKLMIKGPVKCRRGVIILDETNVSEIGGEVEILLVSNANENILARALNLPENPDPYNDEAKPDGAAAEIIFDDDFDVDLEAVDLIEKSSQEDSTKVSSSIGTVNRVGRPVNKHTNDPPLAPLVRQSESDLLFDMIDENQFENMQEIISKPRNISKTISQNAVHVLPEESAFPNNEEELEFENMQEIVTKPRVVPKAIRKNAVRAPPQVSDFPDYEEELEFENMQNIVPEPRNIPISKNPVRVLPKESEFPDDDDEDDLILIADDTRFDNTNTWQKQSNDVKSNCQIDNMSKLKIDVNMKASAVSSLQHTTTVVPKQQTQIGSKRTASVLSPPQLQLPAEKVRCTQSTPKPNKSSTRKITDYLKKGDREAASSSVPKICDNVSELLTANVTDDVLCKTVRGKLVNFDKLSRDGDCWVLNATITDVTGSIDVTFSSQILEKELGFTVTEFKLKKKQKKNNPEIENQLRQGFRSAENKLKNLDALLEVKLESGQKPKIVKIKDITDEQRRILQKTAQ